VYIITLVRLHREIFRSAKILLLPFRYIISLLKIYRLVRQERIDVIHVNTLGVLPPLRIFARRHVSVIWHVHEIIEKPKAITSLYALLILRLPTIAVFISKASKRCFERRLRRGFQRAKVIRDGVKSVRSLNPTEKINVRQSFSIAETDLVISMVGRINKWKGQDLFLDSAFQLLLEKNFDLTFLIVGGTVTGQEHLMVKIKRRILNSGFASRIKLLGFWTDVAPIWAITDVAVVPSIEPEPFGIVALEAMSCGIPVVAANFGGLTEIVRNYNTGLLFRPRDPIDLARCIRTLCRDAALRKKMGMNGISRYINEFSAERFARDFNELYEELSSDN